MRISDNVLNVLAACEYRGIGKAWINKNLRGGESAGQVVRLVSEKDTSVDLYGFEARKASIKAEIIALGDAIDGVTGIGDEDFPIIQSGVKDGDRPIVLFYKDFDTEEKYTRLGWAQNAYELKDALGSGDVSIDFTKQ